MMFVIVDDATGEVTGYLFTTPAPAEPVDALASKVTFGHDPGMMRDLRRVAMDDAAEDLSEWAGDFDAWEDELADLAP